MLSTLHKHSAAAFLSDLEIHCCRVPSSCCCHLRQTVVVANFHMQEVHKHEYSSPRIAIPIQTVIVSLGVYNCHLACKWVHRQLLEWSVCRCHTLNGNQLHSKRFLNNATSYSEFLCSISGTQMISELCYLLHISIHFLKTVHSCLPIILSENFRVVTWSVKLWCPNWESVEDFTKEREEFSCRLIFWYNGVTKYI